MVLRRATICLYFLNAVELIERTHALRRGKWPNANARRDEEQDGSDGGVEPASNELFDHDDNSSFMQRHLEDDSGEWADEAFQGDFPALTAAFPPASGMRFNNMFRVWKQKKELGKGGFGVVWQGTNQSAPRYGHGRKVAIKQQLTEHPDGSSTLFLVEAELQAMRRVEQAKTPFALPLLGEKAVPPLSYMVLPMASGMTADDGKNHKDLRTWVMVKPLRGFQLKLALAQLACSIQGTHRAGVIHHDIKAENVLMDGPLFGDEPPLVPRLLVADYGLASVFEPPHDTIEGINKGTPGFLPPELNFSDTVASNLDWWAFGVVALELVSGGRVDDWANLLLYERKEDRLRVLNDFQSCGEPDLCDMLVKYFLVPDPDKRFSTFNKYDEQLRNHDKKGDHHHGSHRFWQHRFWQVGPEVEVDWVKVKAMGRRGDGPPPPPRPPAEGREDAGLELVTRKILRSRPGPSQGPSTSQHGQGSGHGDRGRRGNLSHHRSHGNGDVSHGGRGRGMRDNSRVSGHTGRGSPGNGRSGHGGRRGNAGRSGRGRVSRQRSPVRLPGGRRGHSGRSKHRSGISGRIVHYDNDEEDLDDEDGEDGEDGDDGDEDYNRETMSEDEYVERELILWQEGYRNGYEEGLAEGLREAVKEARKDVRAIMPQSQRSEKKRTGKKRKSKYETIRQIIDTQSHLPSVHEEDGPEEVQLTQRIDDDSAVSQPVSLGKSLSNAAFDDPAASSQPDPSRHDAPIWTIPSSISMLQTP